MLKKNGRYHLLALAINGDIPVEYPVGQFDCRTGITDTITIFEVIFLDIITCYRCWQRISIIPRDIFPPFWSYRLMYNNTLVLIPTGFSP